MIDSDFLHGSRGMAVRRLTGVPAGGDSRGQEFSVNGGHSRVLDRVAELSRVQLQDAS
ncbi:hypothetical protein ACFV84_18700 [Kitasatospora sp. NPDC059811]|uniref:hypothetical protein n=1 Tax=Streptomycetaceae TaxID=2062 RepID=UPI000A40B660|nr:hypothetical protein [Streptomyces sp. MJM8645]